MKQALASLVAMNVYAGNIETPLKVSSTINNTCTIFVNDMSFGIYSPENGDHFATTDIINKCNKDTSYGLGILLDIGGNAVSDSSLKYNYIGWLAYMKSTDSTNILKFNIFQDSNYTKIFGNDYTPGINWYQGGYIKTIRKIAVGEMQISKIYGAMAGGQYVKAGNYQLSVMVGVYY